MTAVNVTAAAVSVICLAYITGFSDAQRGGDASTKGPAQAALIVPNPHVGQGHHPTFDCSIMKTAVDPPAEGQTAIRMLAADGAKFENEAIEVRAVVVQAFPRIMGVNWFHLCERPNGEVLVASSAEWVEPGNLIVVRGKLSLNRNIGGAYVFPLFVEGADLEGDGVKAFAEPGPPSTFEL